MMALNVKAIFYSAFFLLSLMTGGMMNYFISDCWVGEMIYNSDLGELGAL